MPTNPYFEQGVDSEIGFYDDMVIESIQINGQDLYYLPRKRRSDIDLLGEPAQSLFDEYHIIEMYIETFEGFEGDGTLFQKFGIEIRDQITLSVSRTRWNELITSNNESLNRPLEGDLIYIPNQGKGLFEVKFVEHEEPFYQLNNTFVYKLKLELFEYSGEEISTGIFEIDQIEYMYGSAGAVMTVQYLNVISSPPIFEMQDALGTYFIPENSEDSPNLLHGKLYSVEPILVPISSSPESQGLYNISLGQVTGQFLPGMILIGENDKFDDPIRLEIIEVQGIDSAETNEELFEQDPAAQNVTLEQEADDILVEFDPNNPFGGF